MKQRVVKSNTKFLMIAFCSLLVLTMLTLVVKEENRLRLLGESEIILDLNQTYQEPGITYKGEDITSLVKIDGNVDTTKEGTYQLYYSYQTTKGKTIYTTRTIRVIE